MKISVTFHLEVPESFKEDKPLTKMETFNKIIESHFPKFYHDLEHGIKINYWTIGACPEIWWREVTLEERWEMAKRDLIKQDLILKEE